MRQYEIKFSEITDTIYVAESAFAMCVPASAYSADHVSAFSAAVVSDSSSSAPNDPSVSASVST